MNAKQHLVQQFIQFLHNESAQGHGNAEQISIITGLLAAEFNVQGTHNPQQSTSLIQGALAEAATIPAPKVEYDIEKDPKFVDFVKVIKEKGYFKNVTEGTAEYKERLSKAKEKFLARSNEAKIATAEKFKEEGNQLLKQKKLQEAIACYQKAADLHPTAIYYGNMAAAHLQLGEIENTIRVAKEAIIIDGKYAKAYKWLGLAYVKQGKHNLAVESFEKAKELDPTNEEYDQRIQDAKSKIKPTTQQQQQAPANPFAAMGGMPNFGSGGMPNVFEMMNNPEFMNMAQNMMQNPQFQNFAKNMMQNFGGSDGAQQPNFEELANLPEVQNNPKLKAMLQDIKDNGPSAFTKYQNDPEFVDFMRTVGEKFLGNNPNMQGMLESMLGGLAKKERDDDEDPNVQNMYS